MPRSRGDLDDEAWFTGMAAVYEATYLDGGNPRARSAETRRGRRGVARSPT